MTWLVKGIVGIFEKSIMHFAPYFLGASA